ncbi:hypothetical protein KYB31_02125 [Clostridium felsineum]|uniref:hypothetical protein n=1 Tax=Clostridium felsineum TaxID=36839 RepID=UPI00214D569B|nr:hypothetical protein [Clostridium felsineum]MCR3757792.1 hypothetical protein [Clostridium felsineum]
MSDNLVRLISNRKNYQVMSKKAKIKADIFLNTKKNLKKGLKNVEKAKCFLN